MSLRQHELKNLFNNTILVDKFKPKIGSDEKIIVIALKCLQQLPAKNLEQFIQNGPYDILDVESTESIDKDGIYYVFIEFKRSKDVYEKMENILKNIAKIVDIDEWGMDVYKHPGDYEFNEENWNDLVIGSPRIYSQVHMTTETVKRVKFLNSY